MGGGYFEKQKNGGGAYLGEGKNGGSTLRGRKKWGEPLRVFLAPSLKTVSLDRNRTLDVTM